MATNVLSKNTFEGITEGIFIPRIREISPQLGHYVDHSHVIFGVVQH